MSPLPEPIPFIVGGEPSFTDRLIERLEPWNTGPATGGLTDLERYCRAIAAMFAPVAELAEEEGFDGLPGYTPPYGRLFNPETCPVEGLRYLGQLVGVPLPTGGSEAEWRALVKAEAGLERGSPASIEAVIYRNTNLTKTAHTLRERGILIERRGSGGAEEAYAFGVSVAEASITTSKQTLETEIMSVTPAGLWPWFSYGAKYSWAEATHKWSEDTFEWPLANVKTP